MSIALPGCITGSRRLQWFQATKALLRGAQFCISVLPEPRAPFTLQMSKTRQSSRPRATPSGERPLLGIRKWAELSTPHLPPDNGSGETGTQPSVQQLQALATLVGHSSRDHSVPSGPGLILQTDQLHHPEAAGNTQLLLFLRTASPRTPLF